MIYFEKGRNETIKYEVTYNVEEIKTLIDEIIDNCGAKKHITKDSTLSSEELISNAKRENIKIVNLKRTRTNKTTSYCDTSEDKEIYEYNYTSIKYPTLAVLLNRLLDGDQNAINEIMNYEIEYPENYDNIIDWFKKNTHDQSIFFSLQEEKELNKNNISTEGYYNKVMKLLNFKVIEKINNTTIDAYNNFFSTNTNIPSNKENLEIERKFLSKGNHSLYLPNYEYFSIEQGYLYIDEFSEIRIRSKINKEGNTKYYYTVKVKGDTDLSRTEIEFEINEEQFNHYRNNLLEGTHLISKTRFLIPLDNKLTAELDIYHDALDGLVTIEVEFPNKEKANSFEVPSWFGEEITYDKSYKNKNLASTFMLGNKLVKKRVKQIDN